MPATRDGRSTGEDTYVRTMGGLAGGGVSEGTPVANEIEQLAWVVLRAANQKQAKGSTVRLVVPSAPEVAYEMGVELPECLEDRGG